MSVCEVSQTCSTCKWWGGRPHVIDYQDGVRLWEGRVEEHPPRKTCGSPFILDGSDASDRTLAEVPLSAAVYRDCEDYGASFYTGPDFGCIHHEAKE